MGSVGAADIARGVGNGLGVVRTVRVIAVFRAMSHFASRKPLHSNAHAHVHAHALGLPFASMQGTEGPSESVVNFPLGLGFPYSYKSEYAS